MVTRIKLLVVRNGNAAIAPRQAGGLRGAERFDQPLDVGGVGVGVMAVELTSIQRPVIPKSTRARLFVGYRTARIRRSGAGEHDPSIYHSDPRS